MPTPRYCSIGCHPVLDQSLGTPERSELRPVFLCLPCLLLQPLPQLGHLVLLQQNLKAPLVELLLQPGVLDPQVLQLLGVLLLSLFGLQQGLAGKDIDPSNGRWSQSCITLFRSVGCHSKTV